MSILELQKLKKVTIPNGVERIGNYWFWNCDIESVEIPISVREIGIEAFCYCSNLKKLVFGKTPDRKAFTTPVS